MKVKKRFLVVQVHYPGSGNGLVCAGMGRGGQRLFKAGRSFLHSDLASTTLIWMTAEGIKESPGSVLCLLVTGLWGQAMKVPEQRAACSLESERERHQWLKPSLMSQEESLLWELSSQLCLQPWRDGWGAKWVCVSVCLNDGICLRGNLYMCLCVFKCLSSVCSYLENCLIWKNMCEWMGSFYMCISIMGMYVCVSLGVYVWMYVCVCICVHICMYVCVCIYMWECLFVCLFMSVCAFVGEDAYLCEYVCVGLGMCVLCECVCIFLCIFI